MSLIAGVWGRGGRADAVDSCAALLRAGADAHLTTPGIEGRGAVAFGRALRPVLLEDGLGSQPLRLQAGGLFVFDGRLDNREEIGERLSLPPAERRACSDGALAALAWDRWSMRSTNVLLGDYAIAAWEAGARRLTLLRSPLSMRTLFLARPECGVAFASSIRCLLASGLEVAMDEEALLNVLAGGSYVGTAGSLFRGIRSVPQGHAVIIDERAERTVPLWDPLSGPGGWRSERECAEALRAELDRAVGAQLRRSHGRVAAHLSGGRDSGAVASSAAFLLKRTGEELLAYTGAPERGFAEGAPCDLPLDETALATKVAGAYPNIRHQICRNPEESPLALLGRFQHAQGGPLLTPSNVPWWAAVNRRAAEDGATVLLTGQVGNYSVSAGGPPAVRDLALEGDWRGFGAASLRFLRDAGLRNAATRLMGPLLPRWLYESLRSWVRPGASEEAGLPLLREPWRRRAEELRRFRLNDHRPPASYRAFLRQSLLQVDNAERMSADVYGLDVRDPTADRRLVELALSFPAQAWFGAEDRPAFARAFADRLPADVIKNRHRAYQQADWFEQFKPREVLAAFRRCQAHPFVSELLDMQAVERTIAGWPLGTAWMADPRCFELIEDEYRNKVLPTLAVAMFIACEF